VCFHAGPATGTVLSAAPGHGVAALVTADQAPVLARSEPRVLTRDDEPTALWALVPLNDFCNCIRRTDTLPSVRFSRIRGSIAAGHELLTLSPAARTGDLPLSKEDRVSCEPRQHRRSGRADAARAPSLHTPRTFVRSRTVLAGTACDPIGVCDADR